MSFLLQAADLVKSESSIVSRHYVSEAKHVAKRHVLRIDPAVKSEYCKRCSTPLDFGSVKFRKGKPMKVEC
jgi:RNase P subunit RPR2